MVHDGEALLDYLSNARRRCPGGRSLPGVILSISNMPRMDGREALEQITQSRIWWRIPIAILTTSKSEEDVYRSYKPIHISKPVTFSGLVELLQGGTLLV